MLNKLICHSLNRFASNVCFLPKKLTHLCRMYFPIQINWMSPFPILGLSGGVFNFYSNFKRNFCKQTVENLIRCHILRHLIRFCTVCPTKRKLGLYGFNIKAARGSLAKFSEFSLTPNMDYFTQTFFILTPIFSKVPIQKYGKSPNFSCRENFYSCFKNPSENSDFFFGQVHYDHFLVPGQVSFLDISSPS